MLRGTWWPSGLESFWLEEFCTRKEFLPMRKINMLEKTEAHVSDGTTMGSSRAPRLCATHTCLQDTSHEHKTVSSQTSTPIRVLHLQQVAWMLLTTDKTSPRVICCVCETTPIKRMTWLRDHSLGLGQRHSRQSKSPLLARCVTDTYNTECFWRRTY